MIPRFDFRLVRALGLICAMIFSADAAVGQQRFRLDEDDQWVQTETPQPGTPQAQLQIAREALASGRIERARHLATQWIERNPGDPLLAEAYLLRGDAKTAANDLYKALFDYEFVARTYPGSSTFVTALERELAIAKLFASGTRRKLWGMRILSAADEAEELLIRVQERLPGSNLAEDAALTLGNFYFSRRKMALAADMYAIFLENFPRSAHVETARKRLIYAHLAAFKGPEFDPTGLYEARSRLRSLRATNPAAAQKMGADALLTRIDESDARKLLERAEWYLKTDDYIAAEMVIRRLVQRYPQTVSTAAGLRVIERVLPHLPQSVLDDAPDYAGLRELILGAVIEKEQSRKSTRSRSGART